MPLPKIETLDGEYIAEAILNQPAFALDQLLKESGEDGRDAMVCFLIQIRFVEVSIEVLMQHLRETLPNHGTFLSQIFNQLKDLSSPTTSDILNQASRAVLEANAQRTIDGNEDSVRVFVNDIIRSIEEHYDIA
jgi:hypothetical protein